MKNKEKIMNRQINIWPEEMDIFDLFDGDLEPAPPHRQKPYYPPKTLDAYVRMTTCGKGYPNGKVPAEVVERYNQLIKERKPK